jgi:putative tryptophan/tyrosine transport system substrate-binding protein
MWYSAVGCIVTLILSLLVAPCAAVAQQSKHVPRIGILAPTLDPHDPGSSFQAFRQGLRDLGYVEGQSIALEYRVAKAERLPELATELVRLKVDIIFALGSQAVRAAQYASETIPIVFTNILDPIGEGFVASWARPGANTTGVTFQEPALMGKRLELLKAAVPGVTRVAYLRSSLLTDRNFQEAETAARALGIRLHPVEVREPYPFAQAFATMAEAHADALITPPITLFFYRRTQIVDLALQTQLPGIFPDRSFAEAGGLMAYGPSSAANGRRVATYVDKILQGTKPADLPVERAMKFELVVNLKTAKALGLTIPPTSSSWRMRCSNRRAGHTGGRPAWRGDLAEPL